MTRSCLFVLVACTSLAGCAQCSGSSTADNAPAHVQGPVHAPALVNGDFSRGLEGWEVSGDAASFEVFADPVAFGRASVTTHGEVGGPGAKGTIAQSFTVPQDAVALRFLVHGGRSHVRLYDAAGAVLQEAVGMNDNAARIPVSWELLSVRGQTVKLAIEDQEEGAWGFVSVSGFDVLRDVPSTLVNADFADGLNGWAQTGDAASFVVFRDPLVGGRWSVSTAARQGERTLDAATGKLAQRFVVPQDAVALRFFVHGGKRSFVRLWDSADVMLHQVTGQDSNSSYVPVTWDLAPLAGKLVQLTIEDAVGEGPWGFVGVSGFDVVRRDGV